MREAGFALEVKKNVVSLGYVVDRIRKSSLTPLVNGYIGSIFVNKIYKLLLEGSVPFLRAVTADNKESLVRTNLLFLIFTSFWSLGHPK